MKRGTGGGILLRRSGPVALVMALLGQPLVLAQLEPRQFGISLPEGEIRQPAADERVLTRDEDDRPVVARVHVHVGENRLVMLPDGRLVARTAAESSPTDRPFEPADMDELAKRLLGQFPGFRSRKTRRYLYVYNTSEEFALVTSRILETMFPGVVSHVEAQKIPVHPPPVPLVVLMFRTENEFQQYRRMPPGVVAYYNSLSNRVVMYEESKLARIKAGLALEQSISTIAHEGAHQILHNIGVQQRLSRWPVWLSEGLAEYFAPTTTGRRLKWKGAAQVNDLRMFELEQYLKSRTADAADGQMVDQTVTAARLTSTGYATAWALTHYLAKSDREGFRRYVGIASRLGPLEGTGRPTSTGAIPSNRDPFRDCFGEDFAEIERRLVLHLQRLPYQDPFAEWPHYVALISLPDGRQGVRRLANIFHSATLAKRWSDEQLKSADAAARTGSQTAVREFPNRPLAERFARQWLGAAPR